MAASDAKAVPIKNSAYRVTFPILDADGDLVTAAAGLDSEVSVDGGTFADATSEATEIATSSGMYFLDLTAGEMNGDTIAIIVKTSTAGAKTTPIVLYTAARSINDLAFPTTTGRSLDVAATGEAGVDFSNINGTLDAAEIGTGAITAAKFAAGAIDAASIATAAITAAKFGAGAIDAAAIATGAIDADSIAAAAITAAKFGAGAIDAAAIANGAIDAATFAAGAIDAAAMNVTGSEFTAIPWNAAWDAEVQSEVEDALDVTIADSVPADGTRPSVRQALYMIAQILTDFGIVGTTLTVYKPDGVTALLTCTLNDGTSPTALTRAT